MGDGKVTLHLSPGSGRLNRYLRGVAPKVYPCYSTGDFVLMAITLTLARSSARAVSSTLAVALVLAGARPASAQDPRDAALSRCQQELQYRMGREAGGRQPDAAIDERRTQINQLSSGETRVRGNVRYTRDNNDRGRDFTYDCTYNSRNNSARATYNWSGASPA